MSKPDGQAALQLDDAEGNRAHAVWSRSGKHLIMSVAAGGNWGSASQVKLTQEQVAKLQDFLAENTR
jgi:Tol biopolymer transport system component